MLFLYYSELISWPWNKLELKIDIRSTSLPSCPTLSRSWSTTCPSSTSSARPARSSVWSASPESCESSSWCDTLLGSSRSSALSSRLTRSSACWSCSSPWPCSPSPRSSTLPRRKSRTGATSTPSGGDFSPSPRLDTVRFWHWKFKKSHS